MLIKSTAIDFPDSPTAEDPRVYVLTTDGSEASQLAACFLSFLVCDTDRVHIVHVTEYAKDIDPEEVLKPYARLFRANGDNITYNVIESMYSVTVATTVIDSHVQFRPRAEWKPFRETPLQHIPVHPASQFRPNVG